MARIQFSALVSSITGSVGGGTLQKNRYGYTLRNKPIPINRRSTNQNAVRGVVSYLQGQWQNLSYDQRDSWNEFLNYSPTYSRNSQDRLISGHALFLKYNSVRMMIGESALLSFDYSVVASQYLAPRFFRDSTTIPGVDSLFVAMASGLDLSYANFLCRVSDAFVTSKRKAISKARVCQTVPVDSEVYDLTDSYLEIFPSLPTIGSQVWAEVTLINMQCPVIYGRSSGAFEVFSDY